MGVAIRPIYPDAAYQKIFLPFEQAQMIEVRRPRDAPVLRMRTMHDATEPPAGPPHWSGRGQKPTWKKLPRSTPTTSGHGTASFETEPSERRGNDAAAVHELVSAQLLPLPRGRRGSHTCWDTPMPARTRPRLAYRDTVENSVYLRCDAGSDAEIGQASARMSWWAKSVKHRGFRQMVAVVGDAGNLARSIRLHEAGGLPSSSACCVRCGLQARALARHRAAATDPGRRRWHPAAAVAPTE